MKKIIFFFTLISCTASMAQVTKNMNYQAVARNSSGGILGNQKIGVRFTIYDVDSVTDLFDQTDTVWTNQFGLFTYQIGGTGGISTHFNYGSIIWGTADRW